ncbi:MAG TPA: oxygenase MpaB family protein [Eudoraea sp.]|nr:oxygenase MpaB family protein [Eudoraea sp.]
MKSINLDKFRQQGDPLADQVLRNLGENKASSFYHKVFLRLIQDIKSPLDGIQPFASEFLLSTAELPDWVGAKDTQRCHDMFRNHGRKFLTILYFKSLPLLYFNSKGSEVLVTTARLAHSVDRNDIYARRIAETGKFLLYLLKPNRLEPGALGIRTIQKVRLIHAFTRQSLMKTKSWDQTKFGIPINQEDMVMTLMCFSLGLLEGLHQFGIRESEENKNAFFNTWMGIGSLLGISPELLPNHLGEGQELLHLILQRNGTESKAGKELTRALIVFAQHHMPSSLRNAPASFIRYFNPNIASQLLEENGRIGTRKSFFPYLLKIFFQMEHFLKTHYPYLFKILLAWRSREMMSRFDAASKSMDEEGSSAFLS